jgi:2-dehydro-3-deoxy-D-arabinonate dehydratase
MALWRIACRTGIRVAAGPVDAGPQRLLHDAVTVGGLLASGRAALADAALGRLPGEPLAGDWTVLAPSDGHEIWAAGVTFERSRQARAEESHAADFYDRIYDAERPELFLKATDRTVRGPGAELLIRPDSSWDVPEPELCVVVDAAGEVAAYTIGNDMSSRSIEGENPLYLPQAKLYDASCGLGPCLVTPEEARLDDMKIRLDIDRAGARLFTGRTHLSTMRRRPGELVQWLMRAQTFPRGVFLCTGTSIVPDPELTLESGDLVTISITGLGELVNPVAAAIDIGTSASAA